MRNAKVSIVIPAYNCASYIREALNSVLNQTFRDMQVIVVNDGSTDNTLDIIEEIARGDDRVQVMTQKNSGTASAARNAGLLKAKGEYIAFLDADDIYHPEKIAIQVSVFNEHPDTDIVFSDVVFFTEDIKNEIAHHLASRNFKQKAHSYMSQIDESLFRCHDDFYIFMTTEITALNTQSIMFKRALLEKQAVWFPEEILVGEDADLWYRLAQNTHIMYIDKVLAYYRQRENSLTSDEARSQQGFIISNTINLERAKSLLTPSQIKHCKRRIAEAEFHQGYYYRTLGQNAVARKHYILSLKWQITGQVVLALVKTFTPKPRTN